MKKYLQIFKANLTKSLEYRAALLVWVLVELVTLTSSVFLWSAVFRSNSVVGIYTYNKIISYYLLVPIVGGFTSIFVSEHLPRRIKDGDISSDLMKPFNIAVAALIDQFSFKLTQLTLKLPIYFIVGTMFALFFKIGFDINYLLLSLFVCVFAYLLHFSIDLLVSYSAFWFDDIWSLSLLKYVILMVFGGLTFPLDLLPHNIQKLFNLLPFRFIYYFPIKVAQGLVTPQMFLSEFLQLILWTTGLLYLGKVVWQSGLKKYGAYGN